MTSWLSLALLGCIPDDDKGDDTGPALADDTGPVDTDPGTDDTGPSNDDVAASSAAFAMEGDPKVDGGLGTTLAVLFDGKQTIIAAGAPGHESDRGAVYTAAVSLSDDTLEGTTIVSENDGERAGTGLAIGENGLVVGAPGMGATGDLSGGVYYLADASVLVEGGELTMAEVGATTLDYGTAGAGAGTSTAWIPGLPGAKSLTGLLVGAPDEGQGKAMLYYDLSTRKDLDSPDWSITFSESLGATAQAGQVVDWGGSVVSGVATTVVVGAPSYSHPSGDGNAEGAVFVFSDLTTSPALESDAAAVVVGGTANDAFGSAISSGYDLNGDGTADLAVGAPRADGKGEAYVFFGPLSGELSASDADCTITTDQTSALGTALSITGEDGGYELLVGAPSAEGVEPGAGAAYVVDVTTCKGSINVDTGAAASPAPPVHGGSHFLGDDKNDEFGGGTGGPGPQKIVGAPGDNGGSGAVYVF